MVIFANWPCNIGDNCHFIIFTFVLVIISKRPGGSTLLLMWDVTLPDINRKINTMQPYAIN